MRLILADCVEEMGEMEEASVDAVVCDPPYELGFMAKAWDSTGIAYQVPTWLAALRVLKPGGHLLAFGGTRTYHRLACAVEDAGFEIRDCIAWMYGSGFPKSLDVSKAIDRASACPTCGGDGKTNDESLRRAPLNGCEDCDGTGVATRKVTREETRPLVTGDVISFDQRASTERERRDAPVTDLARRWNGWGTALKPAYEPIVVARKPLTGTVAQNVERYGTGALNVDGCRVDFRGQEDERESKDKNRHADFGSGARAESGNYEAAGRWPANVVLDDEAAELLDEQSGERPGFSGGAKNNAGFRKEYAGGPRPKCHMCTGTGFESTDPEDSSPCWRCKGTGNEPTWNDPAPNYFNDSGGASRFFYTAKASRAERNAGLEGFKEHARSAVIGQLHEGTSAAGNSTGRYLPRANHHPTVKPIALMRWLCRLVTPVGGKVLDPFMGSGTTGIAAVLEGFDFIGIEREPEYHAIAEARIVFWEEHGEKTLLAMYEAERRKEIAETGQLSMAW